MTVVPSQLVLRIWNNVSPSRPLASGFVDGASASRMFSPARMQYAGSRGPCFRNSERPAGILIVAFALGRTPRSVFNLEASTGASVLVIGTDAFTTSSLV